MGLEKRACKASIRGIAYSGTLHVDSQKLEFRCKDLQWTVAVGKGTNARATSGQLKVSRGSKSATFEVGPTSDTWVRKILNPPSRATKLGAKAGQKFWLSRGFRSDDSASLIAELSQFGMSQTKRVDLCDLAIVLLDNAGDLTRFTETIESSQPGTHLWAVWPKGTKAITQSQVMETAKQFGMGPGKSMAFDDSLTAMRFTIK